jgi:hypothetical protein
MGLTFDWLGEGSLSTCIGTDITRQKILSALGSERSDHWDEVRGPRVPATQHGIVAIGFPIDILIGRLFSLLVVPDMQAFIREPD